MHTKIISSLILACSISASATTSTTSEWVKIANSDKYNVQLEALVQSGQLINTKGVTVYIGTFRRIMSGQTEYYKEYVNVRDCPSGHGDAQVMNVDGVPVLRMAYILEGNTVGDRVAKELCSAYEIDSHAVATSSKSKIHIIEKTHPFAANGY